MNCSLETRAKQCRVRVKTREYSSGKGKKKYENGKEISQRVKFQYSVRIKFLKLPSCKQESRIPQVFVYLIPKGANINSHKFPFNKYMDNSTSSTKQVASKSMQKFSGGIDCLSLTRKTPSYILFYSVFWQRHWYFKNARSSLQVFFCLNYGKKKDNTSQINMNVWNYSMKYDTSKPIRHLFFRLRWTHK